MEDERLAEGPPLEPRLVRLHCRRVERQLEPAEHARCPYCFGPLEEIEQGRYECFCDFHPGRDPIRFGFPEGASRYELG